jgi:tripartite-type tricarboxylate transporter receptor subunit TctC
MLKPRRRRVWAVTSAVLIAGLSLSACGGGRAASAKDASVPNNVQLIVPFAAGGGTDTFARVLAPVLSKQVAGRPSVQVVNRPGGESITGTNQFVTQNPNDGSQLLISSATTTFQWLLGLPQVKYDFTKLKPLMVTGTGGVIYASKQSGIRSVEDLKNPPKPLSYGGISATGLDLSALLAFDVLKLQPKTTFGFEGRGPARLALARDETNIDYQTTAGYLTEVQPMVDKGTAVPLMSFGVLDEQGNVERDPNFKNLPTVPEVYKKLYGKQPSGDNYDAYVAFLAAGFTYQKGLFATSETPKPVRDAFIAAVPQLKKDAQFEKTRTADLGDYPTYAGDKVQASLDKAFNISDSVKQYVFDMLKNKYDTTVQ